MLDKKNSNSSILCSVADCTYNNNHKKTCSLSSIEVGRCGPTVDSSSCTECNSFEMRKQ